VEFYITFFECTFKPYMVRFDLHCLLACLEEAHEYLAAGNDVVELDHYVIAYAANDVVDDGGYGDDVDVGGDDGVEIVQYYCLIE